MLFEIAWQAFTFVESFFQLGMEAIWKIRVKGFPAFILVDDKGNDFFKTLKPWCPVCGK